MTDNSLKIRTANLADIAAIQRVAGTTWRSTYAGQIPTDDIEQFLDSAYSLRSLTASISRLGDGFIVAESGGEVIGYVMAGLNRDGAPELYAIYVLEEHHGSGTGHVLWDAALAALARRGHDRMCCWVLASNVRARRFYERRGAILTEHREFAVGATTIHEARYCIALGRQREQAGSKSAACR